MQIIRIPKTPDTKTVGLKPGVAAAIPRALRMLRAVSFDDEPCIETNEIRDIAANPADVTILVAITPAGVALLQERGMI